MTKLRPSMEQLIQRLSSLEAALAETRAEVAEERRARREAETAPRRSHINNSGAAVVDSKTLSRRKLLLKAAGVGAAGVAGSLLLNRPKNVSAAFVWNGGASNAADFQTNVTSVAGFATGTVLRLDANQAANGSTNIDGLQTIGSNAFSGLAAYGGQANGAGVYAVGGGTGGTGVQAMGGSSGGPGISAYGFSTAVLATAIDGANNHYTYPVWAVGGPGYGAAVVGFGPLNGGNGTVGIAGQNGGYGAVGEYMDQVGVQHGVYGLGNDLGVGGIFGGGRAAIYLSAAGAAGPPTSGVHFAGDVWVDANKVLWICITTGTPGIFHPLQPAGMNNALYTAVSTSQYTLTNSNGTTWAAMDATNLKLTITPTFNCQAHFNASADLWTANAGFNQDIGIMLSSGVYPTTAGQPEGWKESGGFAGTFSPNAAAVETIVPLAAGTAYVATLVWKTNKAGSSVIAAGAGPIGGKFSPTRLSARLVATKANGLTPTVPAQPSGLPQIVIRNPPQQLKR